MSTSSQFDTLTTVIHTIYSIGLFNGVQLAIEHCCLMFNTTKL